MLSTAQNSRCKIIPANQRIKLDTIVIEPGSIRTDYEFTFDETSLEIQVDGAVDSVKVCYRTLSSLVSQSYTNRSLATYDVSGSGVSPSVSPVFDKEEIFNFGDVEKFGAITRGVTFGNRQNLFVNSSLNLQLNGKLDDNLNIAAVITDQNVPYQPEGNTQQIRDFD